ncbi:pif1 [Symbiodinium sp. CCMP2592]|nr:pif1 [Symbiodinium sp. CCMP2592]
MLEPYGENGLDSLTLQQVWAGTSKGNKSCVYHSHLAADQSSDAWHVGAGISMTAAALLAAIDNFKSPNMKNLIVPMLYDKVLMEITTLEPTLLALNFGKGSATATDTGSFRAAKKAKLTSSVNTADAIASTVDPAEAAVKFRKWLLQEKSAFRGFLFVLSGKNSYYTGQVAELVARSAVTCKPMSEEDFVNAVKARMQKPEEGLGSKVAGSSASALYPSRVLVALLPVLLIRSPTMTFANTGNSCFVNAGLQAILALPGFDSLRSTTATEQALLEVRSMVSASLSATVPQPILDLYYRGHQEDAAEFIANLLLDCPTIHSQLQGTEGGCLACTTCEYRRPLPAEPFLTLQIALVHNAERLRSVQSAVDTYLNQQVLQEDILHWECTSSSCTRAGTSRRPPLRLTAVHAWPDNLIIVLKRWDGVHGLLNHEVLADERLRVAENVCYRLKAAVSHIGETAATGHYVAYRPHGDRFQRLDDATISEVATNPGQGTASTGEKVYIVCYTRAEHDGDVGRALPVKRPILDLTSSQDSDSDVIVAAEQPAKSSKNENAPQQPHVKKAKCTPSFEHEELKRTPLGNFSNYLQKDREIIVHALKNSESFAEALGDIRANVENFTLTSNSKYRLHRNTLLNWFRRPELAERAQRLVQTSAPQHSFSRKPSWKSALGNLPASPRQQVFQALSSGSGTKVLRVLQDGDQALAGAVPAPTLRRWLRSSGPSVQQDELPVLHQTWSEEYQRNFGVLTQVQAMRSSQVGDNISASGLWLMEGSWTFCPSCGRKRARTKTQRWSISDLRHAQACSPCCDPPAVDLLAPAPANILPTKLTVYTTPQKSTWHSWSAAIASGDLPLTVVLSETDLNNLAVLTIHVDFRSRRGGKAEVTSKQKRSLTRCRWKGQPLRSVPRSDVAARAFAWLLQSNNTYRQWVDRHEGLFQELGGDVLAKTEIQTAELLLSSPAVEVAARPWLYPLASLADTDYQERLVSLGWTTARNKPSIRTGFLRKLESRCVDYARDFPLQCLLYDICMAKTISSVQAIAEKQKVAPEQIASDMDGFDVYWQQQLRKMEDICRQEFEKSTSMETALPSIFFTVAPAEWLFPLHNGMFHEGSLTEQQQNMTLHLYHTLQVMLEHHFLKDGASLERVGILRIRQWSFRFEFQSRGTLHLHAVLWADLLPGWQASDLCGRSGTTQSSAFLQLLEELFHSRADVQCGDGTHNLLQYVAGYVAKASDALSFCHQQAKRDGTTEETSKWRQTYRLLCKRSPMEQEITMEFAGLPMVRHSFSGHAIFAPIPGSKAKNTSRDHYSLYQFFLHQPPAELGCATGMCFMQWLRQYRVVDVDKKVVARRNVAGPMNNQQCGVAMTFPFELLDIFVGAWAATFLPDMLEYRLNPEVEDDNERYSTSFAAEKARRASFMAPDGCKHLKAVLCLDEFQLYRKDPMVFHPNVGDLLVRMETDLRLRGLSADRIATFNARIRASALLLCAIRDGREDANLWTARSVSAPPQRVWSKEQQAVLDHIQRGTTISDAADMEKAPRVLQVAGGPGTGKTEVVIAAVRRALDDGCRVLIAGPIGLLVSMYRLKLPNMQNLTMETVHSAFRITRDADAAYIPPGRLRHFDLIVIDEVSQIEAAVWRKLQTALGELVPCPFLVFVGDFQQLQPLRGNPELQAALEQQRAHNKILYVKLEHHEAARSVDPAMLDFLEAARVQQPARDALLQFFRGRTIPADVNTAARHAAGVETRTGGCFTFLTVTNQGAAALNLGRLAIQFPDAAAILRDGGGIPAEIGRVVVDTGMRMRLTQNIDKDRGFVNGNTGTVRAMLRSDVFLLQSDQGLPILVHPVTQQGRKFLPVSYGWATTIRRAQGATLDKVGLWFDRRLPDRGYGYVGLSRAKRRQDVFLLGRVRRTDWRAVNGENDNSEQNQVSVFSESTHSSEEMDIIESSTETQSPRGSSPTGSTSEEPSFEPSTNEDSSVDPYRLMGSQSDWDLSTSS